MKPHVRFWIAGIVALITLAGGVGLVLSRNQPAAVTAQVTPGGEDPHIQQLRALLSRGNLSEEGRSSVQEKLEIAERLATQQAAGKQKPVARQGGKDPGPAASFMQVPEQPLAEGIFEGSQGLIRPSAADVANVWQGERGGVVYQVFAGSTPEETPRGLVIVVTLDPNRPTGEQQFYVSPDQNARLRIVEVQENLLLLEDDQGNRLYFDLVSRIYHH